MSGRLRRGVDLAVAAGEPAHHAPDPAEVVGGGTHDVDPRDRIVDPVDRHLVDAESVVLGEHQQLGVEEPTLVFDQREQRAGDVGAQRLESALRVGEPGAQCGAQDQVVATRDELPLRAAYDPRARRQARTDGDVTVAAEQRRNEGEQRVEVGGEVDVHVRDDECSTRRPRGPQRAAPSLLGQVDRVDAVEGVGEARRDRPAAVGAGVVGDGDHPAEVEALREIGVEVAYRPLQVALLVVDGEHDVDRAGGAGGRDRLDRRRGLVHRAMVAGATLAPAPVFL